MPTFYRSVASDPPTQSDFLSNRALGKPRRPPHETEDRWAGISVHDTEQQCRKNALKWSLGAYIAEMDVPEDGGVRYGPTGKSGHCTIWGEAEQLLRCVSRVIPLRAKDGEHDCDV